MALVLNDRVQETCSAPGTGAVTLLGAVTGFQTFSSGVGNGNTCYYCIADQGGANWEVGLGTYASSGNTLTRTTPYAGSAATPVNFSSGVQTVFVTYPAEKKVILDASDNVSALGTVSSGTWQGTAVGIAYGGTGQTTASDAFNALSPITTAGDLIIGAGTNSAARLAIGASGYFLKSNGTTASWEAGPSASYVRTAFTATAGQTTFSVSYTPNQVEVFMNGVLLNAADYTASNGTSVALTAAASAGDIVEVIAYNVITTSVTDANNLVGGSAGNVPYQSAPGVTSFVSAGTSGQALVSNGTSAPTWGAVGISGGGTGQTTATAAFDALAPTQTGNSGKALTTNGSTTSWSTLGIAGGGTNQTTYTSPSGNVKGLIYFDGTSFANDTTVTHAGYDTVTNTLSALNFSATGTATLSGSSSAIAAVLTNAAEVCTVSATAATGTINFYTATQSVLYYTTNASGTFVVNLAHSAGTTMNTALSTGQSITTAFLVTQGASGASYYATAVQVDGTTSGVTTKWQGGAPTAGNANGIDVYTFTVVKTAASTYTVLASVAQFK